MGKGRFSSLGAQAAEPGRSSEHRRPAVVWVVATACALCLVLAAGSQLQALVADQNRGTKSEHPFDSLVVVSPRLASSTEVAPLGTVESELSEPGRSAWQRFAARHRTRGAWQAQINRRSGLVEIAEGAGVPWIPGHGNSLGAADIAAHMRGKTTLDMTAMESMARSFLAEMAPLLGSSNRSLRLARGASGRYSDYLWNVEFEVHAASGMKIEGARIFFRVNNGNLVQFGTHRLPPPGVTAPHARLDEQEALQILSDYLGGIDDSWLFDSTSQHLLPVAAVQERGRPYTVGSGYELALVWEFLFRTEEFGASWRARIDAVSGEIVELRDINDYAQVTGGYWPVSWRVDGTQQDQVQVGWPFVSLSGGETSNTSGLYYWDGSGQTARHSGPFVTVDDQCTGAPGTASSDGSGNLTFGVITVADGLPGDCDDSQSGVNDDSASARQQYYHINKVKEKARTYMPGNEWLNQQLQVNVNINSDCNAYWSGSSKSLNFYTSGSGCGNTGEDAGIALHEFAHGLDDFDGSPDTYDNGTGETYGDFTGALQTHNSCGGQGFLLAGTDCGGYGNACNSCDGVRDIDWGEHADNRPWTVGSFTQTNCPDAVNMFNQPTGYVGPCGMNNGATTQPYPEGHCESYVSSGAVWDLAAYDLQSGCSGRNAAYPDWNCAGAGGPYSEAAAWQVVDRLWYLSRPTADQAFVCITTTSPWTSHGCNAGSNWKTMRLADDDDGNLANGTPHSCQMAAAFGRHGIACTSDAAYDVCYRGCTQPSAVTLTVDGTANNQVDLSWTAVSSPDVVDVYRNEVGCSSGFTRIADGLTGTDYSDNDVANGTTYYYQVVRHPEGNEACASEPSNCVSATPSSGPSAVYVTGSASLSSVPTDNDSDGYVDNCETGRISFEIYNSGGVAMTNVRATLTSPDGAVSIVTSMPVNVGALAVNGTTSGTFDYSLSGATCNQELAFDIAVTSDEMQAEPSPVTTTDRFTLLLNEVDVVASDQDSFEADNDGWTLSNFVRSSATSSHGSWSLAATGGADFCASATSPSFVPTSTSTVTIAVRWDIEAESSGNSWDRANVHIIDGAGVHHTLTPTGVTYNQTLDPGSYLCHITFDTGWVGQCPSWPSWQGDAVFDLSDYAGKTVQLEVNYNTDSVTEGTGFWFDNVRWANLATCDSQSNTCCPTPPTFAGILSAADVDACDDTGVRITWATPSSWNDSGGSRSFVVKRNGINISGALAETATSYVDTTGSNYVSYTYTVVATNGTGCSTDGDASATASDKKGSPPTFAGPTSLETMAGVCGLRLDWDAATSNCDGASSIVYNVYRDTSSGFTPDPTPGTGNMLAACVTDLFYEDTGVSAGSTYYYIVSAEDSSSGQGGACNGGRENTAAPEISGFVSTNQTLYGTQDFESCSGLCSFTAGFFSGDATDVRGVRACTAHSGSNVFKWGGNGCTQNYARNKHSFGATPAIAVPAGAANTRLDFWHRWNFTTDGDGYYLRISNDGSTWTYIPSSAFISNAYNGSSGSTAVYNGDQNSFINTVVDLDAACDAIPTAGGGCAGETIYIAFVGFSNGSGADDGFFFDDVLVTADVAAVTCDTAPDPVEFLTATSTGDVGAGTGQNKLEWVNPNTIGYAATRICWSTSDYPDDPASCSNSTEQAGTAGAYDSWSHGSLTKDQTYYYSVYVRNGSNDYSSVRTVSGRPEDTTTGPVNWIFNTGATALAPPGVGSVYGVSNDRNLHSMQTASGDWVWTKPVAFGGASQGRPPVVPLATTGPNGATKIVLASSQDGYVYAVNAGSGTVEWSTDLGTTVQAAPSGVFSEFGGTYDLVLIGTRNAGSGNSFYGLALGDGSTSASSPDWIFSNDSGDSGYDGSGTIGIINAKAYVDYGTSPPLVFFTSRAGGSDNTLWCLNLTAGGFDLAWASALGDIDTSPNVQEYTTGDVRVYVGTADGELIAVNASDGSVIWSYHLGDGPIKGYVWVDRASHELFVSTTNTVWNIYDNNSSYRLDWGNTDVANPSTPLFVGETTLYLGSSDGQLHRRDPSTGGQAATPIALGAGGTVGPPAYNLTDSRVYVGTESGAVYAVAVP